MRTYKIILDAFATTCYYELVETEVIRSFQYSRCGGVHYCTGKKEITRKISEGYASYKDILRWSEKENARVEIL